MSSTPLEEGFGWGGHAELCHAQWPLINEVNKIKGPGGLPTCTDVEVTSMKTLTHLSTEAFSDFKTRCQNKVHVSAIP